MAKPFSVQVSMSLSIADWRTELKRDHSRGRLVLFHEFITFHVSQYGGALVGVQFFKYSLIDWFLRNLQIASCCTESSAFLMSIAATLMSVSHSLLLWDMSLYVIRWSGCLELFLNPAWSAHWHRSSTARSRLYSIVERGVFKAVEDHRSTCSSLDLSHLLSCRSL